MTDEYFYGVTLSSSNKRETWDSKIIEYPRNHKLVIRQVLLGADAKTDEVNVVQVEAMSIQDSVKIPIAVLNTGEERTVRLDIEFPDPPVTFTLTQGSGPVHLIGKHQLGAVMEGYGDMEEIDDEEDEDESQLKEEDDENESKDKKAKSSNNAKQLLKKNGKK